MKILLVNSRQNYKGKVDLLRAACAAKGLPIDLWDAEDKTGCVDKALREGYDAMLHRNEHGRLFGDGSLGWIREAMARGMPVLSTDFGYLDHYKTCMFDFYREDLSSGIHEVWKDLPAEVDWKAAPRHVRKFRQRMLEKIALADGSRYVGKVCIWMQWTTDLLRPELCDGGKRAHPAQWAWINRIASKIAALGLEPVVKLALVDHSAIHAQTVPKIEPWIRLVCDRPAVARSNPRVQLDREANWRLLAGCSYHVLLCSSVSHLMVLAQRPVIATGASWFNALGVFQEPVEWHSPMVRPEVNHAARAKWVNWWLQTQAPWADAPDLLRAVFQRARSYADARLPQPCNYDPA